MIYKPALELYEEITEDYSSLQKKILYRTTWLILAIVIAPITALILLHGKNDNRIKDLVLYWLEEEEDA